MEKTRISKIARLPYKTREQLNLRLLNGELGAPLLQWLNESPDAREILAELFGGKSITKQNLSEWRRGPYQDWLRHQGRQENFLQMNEQGNELQGDEGPGNSFENFSRLILAEMAERLNTLHELPNRDERWQRLREISRDLARLQHSYSQCRKAELSRRKWEYEISADQPAEPGQEQPSSAPSAPDSQLTTAATVQPSPSESRQKNSPRGAPTRRYIRHHRCSRGCICKDCHPNDGEYPYAQAVKDYEHHKDRDYCFKENVMIFNTECLCHCDCAESLAREQPCATGQCPPGATPLPGSAAVPGGHLFQLQSPPALTIFPV